MTPEQLEACRHLLWHYGDRQNGWEPGGFHQSLIRTLEKADINNRARLLEAFPEYETGVYTLLAVGLDELVRVVEDEEKHAANSGTL